MKSGIEKALFYFCRATDCLGILTGAQLFSLNKEELRAVCGNEGNRVFSQVKLQKDQLEVSRSTRPGPNSNAENSHSARWLCLALGLVRVRVRVFILEY